MSSRYKEQRVPASGNPPVTPDGSVPNPAKLPDGQCVDHWILSDEERAKGFVRPVRQSYRHVGIRPKYPLRGLTPQEQQEHAGCGYVAYEQYPESESPLCGRYWTKQQLESGCGQVTSMGMKIAETYARDPKFYGSTFCSTCGDYFRVGEHGEFVWDHTNERVGT